MFNTQCRTKNNLSALIEGFDATARNAKRQTLFNVSLAARKALQEKMHNVFTIRRPFVLRQIRRNGPYKIPNGYESSIHTHSHLLTLLATGGDRLPRRTGVGLGVPMRSLRPTRDHALRRSQGLNDNLMRKRGIFIMMIDHEPYVVYRKRSSNRKRSNHISSPLQILFKREDKLKIKKIFPWSSTVEKFGSSFVSRELNRQVLQWIL